MRSLIQGQVSSFRDGPSDRVDVRLVEFGAIDFNDIANLGTILLVNYVPTLSAGCNFWGGLREVCLVPYRMESQTVFEILICRLVRMAQGIEYDNL